MGRKSNWVKKFDRFNGATTKWTRNISSFFLRIDVYIRTTAVLYTEKINTKALANVFLPSTEDIEEMVMKAKGDAEMDLNRLGVAVDG